MQLENLPLIHYAYWITGQQFGWTKKLNPCCTLCIKINSIHIQIFKVWGLGCGSSSRLHSRQTKGPEFKLQHQQLKKFKVPNKVIKVLEQNRWMLPLDGICLRFRYCPRHSKGTSKIRKIAKSDLLAKRKYSWRHKAGSLEKDCLPQSHWG
jgi:hypothetical protein